MFKKTYQNNGNPNKQLCTYRARMKQIEATTDLVKHYHTDIPAAGY